MDTGLVVLLAAGISACSMVVSPAVTQFFINRYRRVERAEDKKEHEIVASAVKGVSATLATVTRTTLGKLGDLQEGQAVIHKLVNSNMTSAMQSELDATVRDLSSLQEIVELKKAAGREPTTQALAVIKTAETKVKELTAALLDRLKHA